MSSQPGPDQRTTIDDLLASGATVVAVMANSKIIHVFTPPEQRHEEEEDQPIDLIPPYPLQPWVKRRVQEALDVFGPETVWIPQRFSGTQVTILGRKARYGWMLKYELDTGDSAAFYVGDILMRAIRENFPDRINWGRRLDATGTRVHSD